MSERTLAQPQRANTPESDTKDAVSFQRRDTNQVEQNASQQQLDTVSGTFAEPRVGFDFSRVPALTGMVRQTQPLLRTQPMVQRFPKEGAAEPAEPVTESVAAVETTGPALIVEDGGARAVDDPQSIQKELGEGLPLNSGVRSRMESAFGMDLSHVRTHTDSTAAGLSDRLNARAFTVGKHVAFGTNEYKPGTLVGDALITHELAHVVQQSGGTESSAQMKGDDSSYNKLEQDADKSAVGALTSIWGKTKGIIFNIAQNVMPSLQSGLRLQRYESYDEGYASREEAASTTAPSIISWSTRTGDGDSTSSDNCCKNCPVTLGIDCNPPNFRNGIELKATISNHSSGYSYDIKRTKEGKAWQRNGTSDSWHKIDENKAGTPDDPLPDVDECLTPIASDSNHHIYSEDRPGFKSAAASGSYTDKVYKKNFTEFVRITRADSTTYDDSNTQDWHNIVWITKSGSTWSLDSSRSEIDTGHLISFDP